MLCWISRAPVRAFIRDISAPAIYSSDTLGIERQGLDMDLVVVK